MKYFHFSLTPEEAKQLYYELSNKLHPDHSKTKATQEKFIEMKQEYEEYLVIQKHLPQITKMVLKSIPEQRQTQIIQPEQYYPIPTPQHPDYTHLADTFVKILANGSDFAKNVTKAFKEGNKLYRQAKTMPKNKK